MKKNEFGAALDRNGYAPSVLYGHSACCCYLCGQNGQAAGGIDRHEIFGGANREKSKRLGLWVLLCHRGCHMGNRGVQEDARRAAALKAKAQTAAMDCYGWDEADFIREVGKSYL